MGFFSELDIELEPKKEHLRNRDIPTERRTFQEETIDGQISLWKDTSKPEQLTNQEKIAILRDDISSPYWKTGINKLVPGTIPSSYQYAKKRNYN